VRMSWIAAELKHPNQSANGMTLIRSVAGLVGRTSIILMSAVPEQAVVMQSNSRPDAKGPYHPSHPVRFITTAARFDGHDAAINIIRRLLQSQGAEVIHLGHSRSVDEVVEAAIAEDVQGVAMSSYQGGHVEYFKYLVDRLRASGRGDIHVYGGGGGVIVPAETEELDEISERGGVLGAMETGYQCGRIQDDSMLDEHRKHDGTLLIVGVNTFTVPNGTAPTGPMELARSTEGEKRHQIDRLRAFQQQHAREREAALDTLRETALEGGNVFGALMRTVRYASLGEITHALFRVGGSYRGNI
jgi:methylmalonyl-CoA mutase cobalamin-binding domain/chain